MPKIRTLTNLSNITDPKVFMNYCSQFFDQLEAIMNGKIEFGVNISSQTVTVGFSGVNVDVPVNHDLAKTGVVYLIAGKSNPCDIFDGVTAANKNQIFLRSNTSGVTVTLILS